MFEMRGIITIIVLLFFLHVNAQIQSVNVAENSIKLTAFAEEIMYYAFSEGDKLVFSFTELKGKGIKEVEIIEYPSNSKFMEFKAKNIEKKTKVNLKKDSGTFDPCGRPGATG